MMHTCLPPDLDTWDEDEDWTCPQCGQDWWVDRHRCYECGRTDPPRWVEFGTGDGTFPLVSVVRGGIRYGGPK